MNLFTISGSGYEYYEVSVRNVVQRSRTDRSQGDRSPICRLNIKMNITIQ